MLWYSALLLNLLLLCSTSSDAAVLLTGYNPWGNFTWNPSGEVASRLNGTSISGLQIRSVRLDVSEAGVLEAEHHIASGDWDTVVHLGFEDAAKGLKLETIASNVLAVRGGRIADNAPELLPTTADLGAVALDTRNPKELWSRDAGTFFCNELYYRSLLAIRKRPLLRCRGRLVPSIFIHVPPEERLPIAEAANFVKSLIGDLVQSSGCERHDSSMEENEEMQSPRAKGQSWLHIYG